MTIGSWHPFNMDTYGVDGNLFSGYTIQFLMNWLKLSL